MRLVEYLVVIQLFLNSFQCMGAVGVVSSIRNFLNQAGHGNKNKILSDRPSDEDLKIIVDLNIKNMILIDQLHRMRSNLGHYRNTLKEIKKNEYVKYSRLEREKQEIVASFEQIMIDTRNEINHSKDISLLDLQRTLNEEKLRALDEVNKIHKTECNKLNIKLKNAEQVISDLKSDLKRLEKDLLKQEEDQKISQLAEIENNKIISELRKKTKELEKKLVDKTVKVSDTSLKAAKRPARNSRRETEQSKSDI